MTNCIQSQKLLTNFASVQFLILRYQQLLNHVLEKQTFSFKLLGENRFYLPKTKEKSRQSTSKKKKEKLKENPFDKFNKYYHC